MLTTGPWTLGDGKVNCFNLSPHPQQQKGHPAWGVAIKADRVCWLGRMGVRTCSPFEEGFLHAWIGGLAVHPLGWG